MEKFKEVAEQIATDIVEHTALMIQQQSRRVEDVPDMPYKQQFILEEVIKKLQELV